jgi:ubiquinone/menaquinone biosynthesis C-methylase UbiE
LNTSEAEDLIIDAFSKEKPVEKWVDLGCGNGLFTNALAEFLAQGSKIYAIDKTYQYLESGNTAVDIQFIYSDFENVSFEFKDLDGILMANSFHYVSDQEKLIHNLLQCLKPDGKFIIIEYDTQNSNPWVPFPISFKKLKELFAVFGLNKIEKLGERKSIYRGDMMYSAVIKNQKDV